MSESSLPSEKPCGNLESDAAHEKLCKACQRLLPISMFYVKSGLKGYRTPQYSTLCKACTQARRRDVQKGAAKQVQRRFESINDCPPLPVVAGICIRHCVGYVGIAVDDSGGVWSCYGYAGYPASEWRRVPTHIGSHGYPAYTINRVTVCVPVLVATAFHGQCPSGMVVRHFPDRTKTNCAASNLSWCTPKQNSGDRTIHGTENIGTRNGHSKLTDDDVLFILQNGDDLTQDDLAARFGISRTGVSAILHGRGWGHVAQEIPRRTMRKVSKRAYK